MNNLLRDKDFALSLEENAIDSLVHAVEHFLDEERDTNLKYAILHVFHALELFLKAKLAKINKDLIFEKRRKDGSQFTITFPQARKLLENEGILLSKEDKENLDKLQRIRNEIEHYQFSGNREEVEDYVGTAIYFLESFLIKELKISLKNELDNVESGIYETLSKAQLFYIKRMLENGIELHPKYKGLDGNNFINCPECQCEEETIVIPDPITIKYDLDLVHCFLCHAHYYYSVEYCLRCESANYSLDFLEGYDETCYAEIFDTTFNKENFDDENNYGLCEFCQEDIEDE